MSELNPQLEQQLNEYNQVAGLLVQSVYASDSLVLRQLTDLYRTLGTELLTQLNPTILPRLQGIDLLRRRGLISDTELPTYISQEFEPTIQEYPFAEAVITDLLGGETAEVVPSHRPDFAVTLPAPTTPPGRKKLVTQELELELHQIVLTNNQSILIGETEIRLTDSQLPILTRLIETTGFVSSSQLAQLLRKMTPPRTTTPSEIITQLNQKLTRAHGTLRIEAFGKQAQTAYKLDAQPIYGITFLPNNAIMVAGEIAELAPEEYVTIQYLVTHMDTNTTPADVWRVMYGDQPIDYIRWGIHRRAIREALNRETRTVFIKHGETSNASYQIQNARVLEVGPEIAISRVEVTTREKLPIESRPLEELPLPTYYGAAVLVAFLRNLGDDILSRPPSQDLYNRLMIDLDTKEKKRRPELKDPTAEALKELKGETLNRIVNILRSDQFESIMDKLAEQREETLWELIYYFLEREDDIAQLGTLSRGEFVGAITSQVGTINFVDRVEEFLQLEDRGVLSLSTTTQTRVEKPPSLTPPKAVPTPQVDRHVARLVSLIPDIRSIVAAGIERLIAANFHNLDDLTVNQVYHVFNLTAGEVNIALEKRYIRGKAGTSSRSGSQPSVSLTEAILLYCIKNSLVKHRIGERDIPKALESVIDTEWRKAMEILKRKKGAK